MQFRNKFAEILRLGPKLVFGRFHPTKHVCCDGRFIHFSSVIKKNVKCSVGLVFLLVQYFYRGENQCWKEEFTYLTNGMAKFIALVTVEVCY
jgi:hypothetical protein